MPSSESLRKEVRMTRALLIECYEVAVAVEWHKKMGIKPQEVKQAKRVIAKLKRIAKRDGGNLS